jgi:hypothetical protein
VGRTRTGSPATNGRSRPPGSLDLPQAPRRPPRRCRPLSLNLALLHANQALAFVTPKRSFGGLRDGALWAAHRRHPHRVRVLDWLSFSAGHDDWFYGDGTHLRPSGALAYARLLAQALRWIGPDDCACIGTVEGPGTMARLP